LGDDTPPVLDLRHEFSFWWEKSSDNGSKFNYKANSIYFHEEIYWSHSACTCTCGSKWMYADGKTVNTGNDSSYNGSDNRDPDDTGTHRAGNSSGGNPDNAGRCKHHSSSNDRGDSRIGNDPIDKDHHDSHPEQFVCSR
jgi:hypothetical protein